MKTNLPLRKAMTLAAALFVSAASMAAGITLNLRNVTVKKAMAQIENVSKVHFFYKDNLKASTRPSAYR